MIRPGTLHDIPEIFALTKMMHASGRYSKISFDNNTAWNLIRRCIEDDNSLCWLGIQEDMVVSAFLGGISPYSFSTETMATDYGVFTHPAARKSRDAFRMMQEFIHWGKAKGCSEVNIGASNGFEETYQSRLGNFLKRRMGFIEAGAWYVKDTANV